MNTVRLTWRLFGLLGVTALTAVLASGASAAARELPDFTGLVEKYSPAVVNVSTTQKAERRSAQNGGNPDMDEFFRRFFGPGGPQGPDGGRRFAVRSTSFAGFRFYHFRRRLHSDEQPRRRRRGRNSRADERSARIGRNGRGRGSAIRPRTVEGRTRRIYPSSNSGHSNNLKPGEWVLAIGSPFGFDYSVTAGIISAIGRSLPTENNENYVPFIQTDVAINPGNSGGPLFNLDGEVIGINSQIYTRSGGFMGVSFAIPVDVALDVVDQIKAHGKVSRGWLGVVIQEVNRDLAESFGSG